MKKENKCITLQTRLTFKEYKYLTAQAKKAKLYRSKMDKIPCISKYVRMVLLGDLTSE